MCHTKYTGHDLSVLTVVTTTQKLHTEIYTYQKNSNPGHANIIERYSPLERISTELSAICVVLVPINT